MQCLRQKLVYIKHNAIPVFIGDMREWVEKVRICNEKIQFFKIDGGYKICSDDEYYDWCLLFDENGLLHSDTGPAYFDCSGGINGAGVFATHGEYTPGKINQYDGAIIAYISSGKIKPRFNIDNSGIKIKSKDIKTLSDYSGPAYVLTERFDEGFYVFTYPDGTVYSAYPN